MTIDPDLLVADFDFDLPDHLIAQHPLPDRTASRLLVLDRLTGNLTHRSIRDLPHLLRPGDLLVANNSRVIPARMFGRRMDTGGRVELLLLEPAGGGNAWLALAKPAKRLKPGTVLDIAARDGAGTGSAEIIENLGDGVVRVSLAADVADNLDRFGSVPLPPYITAALDDPERYQTTYGSQPGSVAAPTAGLHITTELRESLQAQGIAWAEVTLHVGLGTFRPVTAERAIDHTMHAEWCSVSPETARRILACREHGGRVIAVGTTAARTLETWGTQTGLSADGYTGKTAIFITPGYRWTVVDGLLTNFHLPKSTLLMMVSALAGREAIKAAYQNAIAEGYRFYSFGDAMLIAGPAE